MDQGIECQSAVSESSIAAKAVKDISQIATLPEVTLKIIDLVEDENSSARDLHHLIVTDPALCSRVLKVVNSAFYGLPRQIASINRAVSLLGQNAVKNIVMAASLAKLFRGGRLSPHFDAHDLWSHAVATGGMARMISEECRRGISDEAFLAGLIHDVGILVEFQHDQAKFAAVVEECHATGRDFRECEREMLGATHEDFGAALCEAWKFPKSLAWAARHHHEPGNAPPANRDLPWIVHLADRMSVKIWGGFRMDLASLDSVQEAQDWLGIDDEGIERICERARTGVQERDELITAA